MFERLAVPDEKKHGHRQPAEHQDVNGALGGDQAQDVAIAEPLAAQGHLDLVPMWKVLPGWLLRRLPWKPRVAPKTAVPAEVPVLAHHGAVLLVDDPHVRPHQDMATERAGNELVAVVLLPLRPPRHVSTASMHELLRSEPARAPARDTDRSVTFGADHALQGRAGEESLEIVTEQFGRCRELWRSHPRGMRGEKHLGVAVHPVPGRQWFGFGHVE